MGKITHRIMLLGFFAAFLIAFGENAYILTFGQTTKGEMIMMVQESSVWDRKTEVIAYHICFNTPDNSRYCFLRGDNYDNFYSEKRFVPVVYLKSNPNMAATKGFIPMFGGGLVKFGIFMLAWMALFTSFPRIFDSKKRRRSNGGSNDEKRLLNP